MRRAFIEASNNQVNYGKFAIFAPDVADHTYTCALPGYDTRRLLSWACGWTADDVLIVDLQTGEGARFDPIYGRHRDSAAADLNRHRIWVCPLFAPFLTWLYAFTGQHGLDWFNHLPAYIDLPDAPTDTAGYRRPGPLLDGAEQLLVDLTERLSRHAACPTHTRLARDPDCAACTDRAVHDWAVAHLSATGWFSELDAGPAGMGM